MDAPEKTDKPKNIRVRILTIVAGVVGVVGVGYLFSQSCLFLASIAGDLELRYYGIATRGTVIAIKSDECSYWGYDIGAGPPEAGLLMVSLAMETLNGTKQVILIGGLARFLIPEEKENTYYDSRR